MCRQMVSLLLKPWPLAMTVFLALAAVGHAMEANVKKIPACPPKKGYTALYSTEFVLGSTVSSNGNNGNGNGKKTHGSPAAAEAACNADASCFGFTHGGSSYAVGSVTSMTTTPGKCSYVKKRCPVKPGYTGLWNMVWTTDAGSGASESDAGSIDAAQAACDANELCGGFTSGGKLLQGTVTGQALSATPLCTYVKDSCPTKYGYTAYPNTALAGVTGEDGIATGQLSSKAQAEEFCKLEFRCSGYSSDGFYFIGGIADMVPSPGICSYVKNPCPPMAGFTVFADSTLTRAACAGRQSSKCLSDVYKACLNDPACKAFNNMRYYWSALPAKDQLDAQLTDATGLCFYVKIEETLEGSMDA